VTVHWKEGSTDHEFDVTQYLVSDQPIPTEPEAGAVPGQQGALPGLPGALPGALPGQSGARVPK
jgi:hypothetical protein